MGMSQLKEKDVSEGRWDDQRSKGREKGAKEMDGTYSSIFRFLGSYSLTKY